DTGCTGQCEACDVPQALGQCVAVVGAPHAKRTGCATATAAAICEKRSCDGNDRVTCSGFVGADVTCRAHQCQDNSGAFEAKCDGHGQGLASQSGQASDDRACAPFACGGSSCKTECTADTDCAPGASCDLPSRQCKRAATCGDTTHVVSITGQSSDCA